MSTCYVVTGIIGAFESSPASTQTESQTRSDNRNCYTAATDTFGRAFCGKVMHPMEGQAGVYLVSFTSVPAEIDAYFQAHLKFAGNAARVAPRTWRRSLPLSARPRPVCFTPAPSGLATEPTPP
jgi:hypothetical protein